MCTVISGNCCGTLQRSDQHDLLNCIPASSRLASLPKARQSRTAHFVVYLMLYD